MAGLPSNIGSFEVVRQIGAGGMGAVYLGRDPELNRQVAIKVIRETVHDQEVLERFFREARAAAALRHPNIITIYASGQHEHQPYIAMEFVEGESLADVIRERTRLTLDQKISYIDQICAGLNFAHRAGIVHRDIKPANVMVDRDEVVRILDFGIARVEGSGMTQDGALIGSLNYMSPEQMLGRAVDSRSDIFSVGSLAYELLTYQQAFKGTLNDGLLHRLPNEDPPPPSELDPSIPQAVSDVVMRALEKDPDKRFQNLADMRAALQAAHTGGPPPWEDRTIAVRRGDLPQAPGALDFLFEKPPDAYQTVVSTDFLMGDTANALRQSTEQMLQTAVEPAQEASPSATPETQVPHSQVFEPPPAVETPPPAAPPPAAPTPVPTPVPTQTKPPTTISGTKAKPPGAPAAVPKPPSTVNRPAAVKPVAPPPAAAKSSSGKWIGIGAAVLVLAGGAAVLVPRFTAQPDPAERERPRVVETMERFRTAYRTKNLAGINAVFPSLPPALRQAIQGQFNRCLLYDVQFSNVQVEFNPDATQAKVDVQSVHECTPNSNERQTTTNQRDVFTLGRQGEDWRIDSVARAN